MGQKAPVPVGTESRGDGCSVANKYGNMQRSSVQSLCLAASNRLHFCNAKSTTPPRLINELCITIPRNKEMEATHVKISNEFGNLTMKLTQSNQMV